MHRLLPCIFRATPHHRQQQSTCCRDWPASSPLTTWEGAAIHPCLAGRAFGGTPSTGQYRLETLAMRRQPLPGRIPPHPDPPPPGFRGLLTPPSPSPAGRTPIRHRHRLTAGCVVAGGHLPSYSLPLCPLSLASMLLPTATHVAAASIFERKLGMALAFHTNTLGSNFFKKEKVPHLLSKFVNK